MKAYFTRKPMTIEDAKANAAWAKAERQEPVEVTPIASVPLTPAQYAAFCKAPLRDWDFLAPYADQSGFTKDGADCVIIECEDHPSIALALEGFTYGRYVGWLV